MKIILFGASGKTGRIFMKLALEQGHEVTAVVRDPNSVTALHQNLQIAVVGLFDREAVRSVAKGKELAVSCLGGDANKKSTMLTDMMNSIVPVLKESGVKTMFHISSAGIHDEMPGAISKIIINLFFKNAIADHKSAAKCVMDSGMDYLILRPLSLTEGELTKKFRMSYDSVPKGGREISREDVAYLLSKAIGDEEYRNKSIGICY